MVSDIPAGDGKTTNLFYSVVELTWNPWSGDGIRDGGPAPLHGGEVDQEPLLLRLPPIQGPGKRFRDQVYSTGTR